MAKDEFCVSVHADVVRAKRGAGVLCVGVKGCIVVKVWFLLEVTSDQSHY
jgi:hypothetical protein